MGLWPPALMVRRDSRSVTAFGVLTFLFSWLAWELTTLHFAKGTLHVRAFGLHVRASISLILYWLGFLTPGIVALLATFFSKGIDGLRQFVRRGFQWRVGFRGYLYALLIPLLVGLAILIDSLRSGFLPIHVSPLSLAFRDLAQSLFLGALCEEIGWRGYMLPRLQSTSSGLRAGLMVGITWGVWHLPVRSSYGSSAEAWSIYFTAFCVLSCGLSVILTWIYNVSRGSLLPVILFHSTVNSVATLLVEPMFSAYGMHIIWVEVALAWTVAIIILLVAGPNLGKEMTPSTGGPDHR